jgi:hypothetical protein
MNVEMPTYGDIRAGFRGAHGARAPGLPTEGSLPRKTEKFLKFLLRLTFAAKARRAKETKGKIMEVGG